LNDCFELKEIYAFNQIVLEIDNVTKLEC
jgi:hypothetical protein